MSYEDYRYWAKLGYPAPEMCGAIDVFPDPTPRYTPSGTAISRPISKIPIIHGYEIWPHDLWPWEGLEPDSERKESQVQCEVRPMEMSPSSKSQKSSTPKPNVTPATNSKSLWERIVSRIQKRGL